jgi:Rrf2 family protein
MKVSLAAAYALHALSYMVRHITELPVPTSTIAKAEGIPPSYLAKIFGRLTKARLIRAVKGHSRGYVFARAPEDISLLEVLEVIEGGPVFDDCLLRYCECGGTPENCLVYGEWNNLTKKINQLFAQTSLATAAWNHPEHRFNQSARSAGLDKGRGDEGATDARSDDA